MSSWHFPVNSSGSRKHTAELLKRLRSLIREARALTADITAAKDQNTARDHADRDQQKVPHLTPRRH
jgi:ERCC4-type nuclease